MAEPTPDLAEDLRALARVKAPDALESRVMSGVNRKMVLGLPAKQWGYVAACLGVWAVAVQGIVGWTVTSLG
jgi:hypothetical protein